MTEPRLAPAETSGMQVMNLVLAKISTYALGVFAELGIADMLASGPKPVDELARMSRTHARSLHRLLRTLAGLDILVATSPGVYGLTEAGNLLRSDIPASMRGIAVLFASEFHGKAWAALGHSVATGESAFTHAFGMPLFEYLAQHPDLAAAFDAGMTASSIAQSKAIVDAYDFTGIGTLIDVGGGHGTLLATVLQRHPSVRGVLVERPQVVAGADQVLKAAGVRDRVDVQGVDFFARVPAGADAYIMKRIIHDWDDESATLLLRNCRDAMAPGGRVLVADAVLDESPDALYGKLLDIEMLVLSPHGTERTEEEFRQLLSRAGLRLERIVNTPSPLKIIESRRA